MATSRLYEALKMLSLNSVESVQNGSKFTELDDYMHVERPIERRLKQKMAEIDREGGGIVLLIGSAGDGKSHLISRMKTSFGWGNDSYYNDATASSSPKMTAIDTLKQALVNFDDNHIEHTNKKLVLAINLGKLNAFIDDQEVKNEYSKIVNVTEPIFDDDDTTPPIDSERIKVVLFTDEQSFEFYAERDNELPVDSRFLNTILERLIAEDERNPFYTAYKKDIDEDYNDMDPILLNYQLLMLPNVRHTIVMTVIEAIVRFRLVITPREFLDFIYAIMVYPHYLSYNEKSDFYEALLPSLLYTGQRNLIQKAIFKLDPLKNNSTENDKMLALLFTSFSIPERYVGKLKGMPTKLIRRTNQFYENNGKDIERTSKFVFRLLYLSDYRPASEVYTSYLSLLCGIFSKNTAAMSSIYKLVSEVIPRHYGSYYDKKNMVPLNIQGGRYRMFVSLKLQPERIDMPYSPENPSMFSLRFPMSWKLNGEMVHLNMDYQLYNYLLLLKKGRLAISYENERNLAFGRFLRELADKCDAGEEITIVCSDNTEKKLTKSSFGNIELV